MCGRLFTYDNPQQIHHAVYGREKKFAKWLDRPENLVILCKRCHENHGDMSNFFMRCYWWTYKIELGYDMKTWHAELPMIIKDHFDGQYANIDFVELGKKDGK